MSTSGPGFARVSAAAADIGAFDVQSTVPDALIWHTESMPDETACGRRLPTSRLRISAQRTALEDV